MDENTSGITATSAKMADEPKEITHVAGFSLYEKNASVSGIYIFFMVNRFQMLFTILIMPQILIYPFMVWGIIVIGLISNLNLILLSKWLKSGFFSRGYQGFVELLGEPAVRILAFFGMLAALINITTYTPGYVGIIHEHIFPSMNPVWLILFIVLICCYLASKGIANTVRFASLAFLFTFGMVFLFSSFFFPPIADHYDLYPLIPTEWTRHSWSSLLFLWSSFAGAEYLVCLGPWFKPNQKMLTYLSLANLLSMLEYLVFFIAALFFFGPDYLGFSKFPIVNMLRYLQSPVLERIDIILLAVHMIHFVFAIALFMLYVYGAVRITFGRINTPTSRSGFLACIAAVFVAIVIVNHRYWLTVTDRNFWLEMQVWVSALTYLLVPTLLFLAVKRKGRA